MHHKHQGRSDPADFFKLDDRHHPSEKTRKQQWLPAKRTTNEEKPLDLLGMSGL
ncbi:MAG TPA: hypothetical protein VFV87_14165 [Pirellulaceae bacterium]|nr:hypothetical protein [Pirellulaceae bacterium]